MSESKVDLGRRQGRRIKWMAAVGVVVLLAIVVTVVLLLAGGNKAPMPVQPGGTSVTST